MSTSLLEKHLNNAAIRFLLQTRLTDAKCASGRIDQPRRRATSVNAHAGENADTEILRVTHGPLIPGRVAFRYYIPRCLSRGRRQSRRRDIHPPSITVKLPAARPRARLGPMTDRDYEDLGKRDDARIARLIYTVSNNLKINNDNLRGSVHRYEHRRAF